jgi:hypothetical protein
MTHCWLTHSEPLPSPRKCLRLIDRVEYDQEVQVE